MGKKVMGTLLVCDKVDSQGDFFPAEVVAKAVLEFNNRDFRTATVGYGSQVQDIMGMVSQLTMDGHEVMADVEFFEDDRTVTPPHDKRRSITPSEIADLVKSGKLAYGVGGKIRESKIQWVDGVKTRKITDFEIVQVGIVDARKKIT